jgi:hypothetical protein
MLAGRFRRQFWRSIPQRGAGEIWTRYRLLGQPRTWNHHRVCRRRGPANGADGMRPMLISPLSGMY